MIILYHLFKIGGNSDPKEDKKERIEKTQKNQVELDYTRIQT